MPENEEPTPLEPAAAPQQLDEATTPTDTKEKKLVNEDKPLQRADPTFKRLSEKEAVASRLKERSNEFKIQETSSPDLFIEIPEGVSVKGTLFDFCRQYSIIEFKSYRDALNLTKMHNQMARVHWWAKQHPQVELDNILNVIVSAAKPESFFESCKSWGVSFEATRPGIYEGRSLFQHITIVVCEELPLERKYASWLLFVPPHKEKWRKAVLMMAREKLPNLLIEAQRLRPKEFREMTIQTKELAEERYAPEEREEQMAALIAMYQEEIEKFSPEQVAILLSVLPPEERLEGLPLEERLSGLTLEERLKGLPPEERLSGLTLEEEQQLLRKLQEKLGQNQPKTTDDTE